MPIPAAIAPAARSAYRDVLRSARITFQGDPDRHVQLLDVLRTTFLSPTLAAPNAKPAKLKAGTGDDKPVDPTSAEELAKRVEEWKEVALFLRRNVVQGTQDEQTGRYSESLRRAWRVLQCADAGQNSASPRTLSWGATRPSGHRPSFLRPPFLIAERPRSAASSTVDAAL